MRVSTAVLTRCSRDEGPYLNGFVAHYLRLKFDKIYIVNTDESPRYILENVEQPFHDSIKILCYSSEDPNWQEGLFSWVRQYLTEDWILNVDIDEFLCISESCVEQYLYKVDPRIEKIRFKWVLCISDRYLHNSISEMNSLPIYSSLQFKSMVRNNAIVRLGVHDTIIINSENYIDEPVNDSSGFIIHYACRGFLDLINRIVGRNYGNIKTGQTQENLLRGLFNREPRNLLDHPFRFIQYKVIRSLPFSYVSKSRLPRGQYLKINNRLLRIITKSKLEKLDLDDQIFGFDEGIENSIESSICLRKLLLEDEVPAEFCDLYIHGELSLTNTTLAYIRHYRKYNLN